MEQNSSSKINIRSTTQEIPRMFITATEVLFSAPASKNAQFQNPRQYFTEMPLLLPIMTGEDSTLRSPVFPTANK